MTETTFPRRLRRVPLLALLLAFTLLAAACSDESSSSILAGADTETDSGTSTTTDGDSTDTDAAGETETDGDAAADMDDADTEDADTDDADTGDAGSSGASSTYCALSLEQNAIDDEFNFLAAEPADVEAYFLENRDRLAEAVSAAPPEIRDDLETILTAFDEEYVPVLAAADWDFLAAADELQAISDTPEFREAQERLTDYDTDVCGVGSEVFDEIPGGSVGGEDASELEEFLSTPEGLDTLLDSDFGREALIAGFTDDGVMTATQAECLVDNVDTELLLTLASVGSGGAAGETLTELLALFDTCGIDPEQFS